MSKVTMSDATIRERLVENREGLTQVDMRAIELFLQKREYRDGYNKRPEVKRRRAEYNAARSQEVKRGKELLASLVAVRNEIAELKTGGE